MKKHFPWIGIILCGLSFACSSKHASQEDEPVVVDTSHNQKNDNILRVELSDESVQSIQIATENAQVRALVREIRIPADVTYHRDKLAHVSPLIGGQLQSVSVTVGQEVHAGDVLATLRSVDLGQARAAYAQARSEVAVAKKNRDRQRALRQEGINSERSLSDAELAYAQATASEAAARSHLQVFGIRGGEGPDMPLTAPIDGTVVKRHATQGENVSPSDTLFVIADLRELWIEGKVVEQNIPYVHVDMPATLTLSADTSHRWEGVIAYVDRTVDPVSGTMDVRLVFDNTNGALRPGMRGMLHLDVSSDAHEVLTVPTDAIQRLHNQTFVWVPDDHGNGFTGMPVQVGQDNGTLAEIVRGIDEGTRIVTTGAFVLTSELAKDDLGGH